MTKTELEKRLKGEEPVTERKSIEELRKQHYSSKNVDSNYINSFLKDSQDFTSSANSRYKSAGYSNASSLYSSQKTTADDLRKRANTIKGFLQYNPDKFKGSQDILDYIDNYQKSADEILKSFKGVSDYYSQWENEDAYNYSVSQAEKKEKYSDMTDEELDSAIDENEGGFWDKIMDTVSTTGLSAEYLKTTTSNLNADPNVKKGIIADAENDKNKIYEKQSDTSLMNKEKNSRKWEELDELPEDVKSLIEEYTELDRTKDESDINTFLQGVTSALTNNDNVTALSSGKTQLRKKEIAEELETKGVDNWQELVGYNRIRRDKEYYQPITDYTEELATEHPVLASGASVLASPTKVLGVGEMVKSAVSGTDAPLNYNSPYFAGNNFVNTTRNTVMENYDWEGKNTNIDWFDQIYSGVMSTGDSLFTMALTGGTGAGGVVLGASAASDTAQEVALNGGSKEQALLTGLTAGVNEMLWESVSIGKFNALKEKGISKLISKDGIKTLAGNLLKSAGVNASEEAMTEVSNIISDYIINGGASDYAQAYEAYLSGGYTEDEAREKARDDMINQVVMSGIGGAMQGLFMGSLGSGIGTVANRAEAAKYTDADVKSLQNKALELGLTEADIDVTETGGGPWNESGFSVNKVAELISKVEEAQIQQPKNQIINKAKSYGIETGYFDTETKTGLKKLVKKINRVETEIETRSSELQDSIMKNAMREHLIELGESETNAKLISNAVIKNVNGEELDAHETTVLKSKQAQAVYDEFISGNAEWVDAADIEAVRATKELIDSYKVSEQEDKPATKAAENVTENAENITVNEKNPQQNTENVTEIAKPSENTVVTEEAKAFASQMETSEKKQAALKLYNKYLDRNPDYKAAFDAYYNAGLKGIGTFEGADKYITYAEQFPQSWRRAVFNAGRETKTYTPGVNRMYVNNSLSKAKKAQLKILDEIGKKYGISFLVFDELSDEGGALNGIQFEGTNKIAISLSSEGSLYLRTAGHEVFHIIEKWNSEAAQELRNKVIEYLKQSDNYDYATRTEEYAKTYSVDADTTEGLRVIHSEMAADCMFDVFSNEKFVKKLVNENETLGRKIKNFLTDFIPVLRKLIKSYTGSAEMNALKEQADILEEINKSFATALDTASANMKNALSSQAETKNTAQEDGVRFSFIGYTKDGRRVYSSGFDESVPKEKRVTEFKKKIATIFNLGAVELKTNVKKIRIKGDKFTSQENLYGDSFAQDGELNAKINSLYDMADILATSKYDPTATNIEESYANPSIKPKNKAHKGVKYWYKFRNEIVFDGVSYTVTFNIRDKGSEQYQYLIDFKENKTSGLSNTAGKSLLRADQMSYKDKVAQKDKNVNNKSLQKVAENTNNKKSYKQKEKPQKQFSLSNSVEETKELVAVHNLSEEKLLKSLKLGGLPMPSIAIIRAKEGYNDFGDVSLVFSKDTIDPRLLKSNKVYSRDAYTPTYPHIEYKVSYSVADRVEEKINKLLSGTDYETAFGYLGLDYGNINDSLNRNGGDVYEAYGRKQAFKLAYLKDKGIELELPKKEDSLSYRFDNDIIVEFAEKYGKEKIIEMVKSISTDKIDRLIPEIKTMVENYYSEIVGKDMDWQIDRNDVWDFLDSASKYYRKGIIKETEDSSATRQMIDDAIDEIDYKNWLNELFSGIIEKEGLRNNKDLFTPSGNRRSFEALHDDVSLNNIIKAMKLKGEKGITVLGGSITGASAIDFSSVEEIKSNSDKIKRVSEEEVENTKREFRDRLREIASTLPKHHEAYTSVVDLICEAVARCKTKSGIANYIRKEGEGWINYSDYAIDDIWKLVNDIRNSPVSYFEAKPQRAVMFDEVKAVIIPDNAPQELREQLDLMKLNVLTYEHGNDNSRTEVLNSIENVKFSRQMSSSARKIIDSSPELSMIFKELQQEAKLSKGFIPEGKRIKEYAQKLKKDNMSTLSVSEIEKELRDIYEVLSSLDDSEGYEYASELTSSLAIKVVSNSKVLDDINAEKKELRGRLSGYLKGKQWYLSPEMRTEIEYHYDSYGNFHKKIFGRGFSFSDKSSNYLDSDWSEICAEFPELFDSDTPAVEQPLALLEAFSATEYEFGLTDDDQFNSQVKCVVTDIMNVLADIPAAETAFDKMTAAHFKKISVLEAQNKEKISELKQQYADDIKRTQEQADARYKLQIKRNIESQKAAEIKKRIETQIVRLSNMLAKGSKNRHIPLKLIDTVRELCYAITLNPASQTKLGENLSIIEASYAALKQGKDGPDGKPDDQFLMNAYDEYVHELIKQLKTQLQHKLIGNMSLEELQLVDETVRAVAQRVSRGNELHIESRNSGVDETANAIAAELGPAKVKREYKKAWMNNASDKLDNDAWKFLKPVYAWRMMGSDTFAEIMGNIRKGEDTWATDLYEAREKITDLAEKYNKKEWSTEKQEVKLSSGTYQFSVQQMMMLYVAFQREQYRTHLIGVETQDEFGKRMNGGGFVFEDAYKTVESVKDGTKKKPKVYRQRDAGTHRLAAEDFDVIANALSSEQKGYADEMRDYLSKDLAVKGNEITRKLYDMNKFTEDKYFPIKVAREFLDGTMKEPEVRSVLSTSIMKDLQENAANPVLLRDFDAMWAEHVQQMAMFHAFALPLDDYQRVYNFRTTKGKIASVKTHLETSCGKAAVSYIENFIKDVNGGVRAQNGAALVNNAISKFKKGAVFASASVAIQQPSAIARALAVVDAKYFAKTTVMKRDYDELSKYAPVARVKAMGFFDTSIGQSTVEWLTAAEYTNAKDKAKAVFTDSSYRDELLSKAPEKMDELTWGHIWNAVKAEQAEVTGLKGEDLLQKAGERFTEVIELTQVYDSVFSKSELMRSKDTGVKMMTAFMAEPTVSFNMLVDATVQAKRGNLKGGARFVGAFAASAILNNILKALVTAPRDDDEEKTLVEKYIASVTDGILNDLNPLSLIPIARDVISIFNGYSVERADMSLVQDVYDALTSIDSSEKSAYRKVEDVAGAIAAFLGLPVKNVMRDFRGAYNFAIGVFGLEKTDEYGKTQTVAKGIKETTAEGIKKAVKENFNDNLYQKFIKERLFGTPEEQLYEAIKNNDYAAYEKLQKNEYGGDSAAVISAVTQALADYDERVFTAAQARLDQDFGVYNKAVTELNSEHFPKESIRDAIDRVYNKLKDATEEETEEAEEKEYSLYSSTDLNIAIETGGDYDTVIEDMIETGKANGKTEEEVRKSIRTNVTKYWKQRYLDASESERKEIRSLLGETGIYDDIENTAAKWVVTALKDEYVAATSDSERNRIRSEIWATGYYDSYSTMNKKLRELLEEEYED